MILFNALSDPALEQSLEIVLTGAPAAELAWVSTYTDLQAEDIDYVTLTGTTNGVTAVTIVEVPPVDSDTYQLKTFNTKNQNAASVTVIIQYNDNATTRELFRITLAQHESLIYEESRGWYVIDSTGRIKVLIPTVETTTVRVAQSNPAATTLTTLLTVTTGKRFEDGTIIVANRSAVTVTFRLSLAIAGAVDSLEQYFAYDLPINANDVYESPPLKANSTDVFRVYASAADLSFTINGKEIS